MSKKSILILRICFLSFIAIVLLGLMAFVIFYKFNWSKSIKFNFGKIEKSELIYSKDYKLEEVNKVKLNLSSADVDIKYSQDEKIYLEVYDDSKDSNFEVNFSNGVLDVDLGHFSVFCIGICMNDRRVVLYLPKEYSKVIDVSSSSGDITIENFDQADMNILSISGEVNISGVKDLEVKTTSGDISVKNIQDLVLKTTSGEVEVYNVNDISASSVSGDFEIKGVKNYISIDTVSGEVDIKDVVLNKNSKIHTTSGDVDIEGINLVYVNTSTTSGDVDVDKSDRMSKVELVIKTTSGDIDVK